MSHPRDSDTDALLGRGGLASELNYSLKLSFKA